MTRYRVATPTNGGLTRADKFDCPEVSSTDAVGDILRASGFEGCSVWCFDGHARHWGLIFDTSLPDAGRLPGSLYWCNVAQNENENKRGLRDFASLAFGDEFAFTDAVGFSIGRKFRKVSARKYVQIPTDGVQPGNPLDTVYTVGTTSVHVRRSFEQATQ